jgi:hypothetical protein
MKGIRNTGIYVRLDIARKQTATSVYSCVHTEQPEPETHTHELLLGGPVQHFYTL